MMTNASEEVTVTGAQHMVAWSSEEQLSSYCELCRAESAKIKQIIKWINKCLQLKQN